MVVKEKRGRRRYIAFSVISSRSVGRQEVLSEMSARSDLMRLHAPVIIQYGGNKGIVRCDHAAKEETLRLLRQLRGEPGMEYRVEPLRTSGTLRTLREKYFSERG